jgi:hypothetical protein
VLFSIPRSTGGQGRTARKVLGSWGLSAAEAGGIFRSGERQCVEDGNYPGGPRPRTPLTPQQQAEARRIYDALKAAVDSDLRQIAELLASRPDGQLLGATEFEVRDRAHAIGAKAVRRALTGRKKR